MPPDWRADEDSIIFPHQGGFRQVGDLWAQVLISFFFDTVAVAVRVGIVGLGGFNPVEIRSGQFRNLFRHRFGIARCGEINNQRFSRILSGSADNRQPFCLQQRVQLFPDCVCFPGADVPGHDIKQLVQLCGCYAQIQADAHVRAGHWFHTAYGREDGYGSQFAFIIGQNTACDLLILGQILTGTPGDAGSRALGEVHYNVRSDIINAAAGWLAEVHNEQLLAAVYRFNAAAAEEEAAWPYYDPSSKAVNDPTKAAERVRILLESGIPLVKNWVHEVTETPQPGDDDEVYTRPDPSGQLSPALVAKALDGMPAASRDYFLAAIQSAASTL